MGELAEALARAKEIDVDALATQIEEIGFSCTQCGECCRSDEADPHTATVYPEEIRRLRASSGGEWQDVARPMPYGLAEDGSGETFEWALQTDGCGDCVFLESRADGSTACSAYTDRPLICRTYPFQLDLTGVTAPQATLESREDDLLVYECEGLGNAISRTEAEELAATVKRRAIRDIEEAMAVLEGYDGAPDVDEGTVVYDSEGPKRPDGRAITGKRS